MEVLPREFSIFNSDDDDVVMKYSIDDGMSTYEVDKTQLWDAYNARGSYSGTVSRAKRMPHGQGGVAYDHQGQSYEGDWHMGHWHGYGIIQNAVGDVFDRKVVNDLKEGDGWADLSRTIKTKRNRRGDLDLSRWRQIHLQSA
jgi:hypothetical protein